MKKVLIEKKQSGKRRIEYHADGIDLHYLHADKGGKEEGDGDIEMPGILRGREVLAIHQKQGCGSHQANDGWTKTDEDALNG